MLMGTNHRRVEHHCCQIGRLQRAEDHLPNPGLGPAIESLKHRVPSTESLWQVSPRRSGSGDPNHGIHEKSIVLPVASRIALSAQQQGFDARPLLVR